MDEGFPHVDGVEHRYVDADRLRMHVAEAGAGEPVLLLHGWPQHWYLWRDVIPRLAPHARVICPDLRGFGWTDVARGGYDKETMARDIVALMDALEIERARVIGHDWGAWIGFLLGLRHAERVERFVGCNILPPWPDRDPRALLGIWRLSYQALLGLPRVGGAFGRRFAELGLRSTRALSDDEVAAFVDRMGGERGRVTELLYRTFLLREFPRLRTGRYSPAGYAVPTLILFGDRDQVIPVASVERAVAPVDSIELELVPGASHFVVDEQPELIAERSLDFLGLR